jgi:hypothetical protein
MIVDPANAQQLANIASEIGADVLQGGLRNSSKTGSWPSGIGIGACVHQRGDICTQELQGG